MHHHLTPWVELGGMLSLIAFVIGYGILAALAIGRFVQSLRR